ncbi:MAG: C45 family peptidase [Bacteroidota bacterium]|nr:C45 family peptidase [Bacteroidota bacterium]MDP4249580.1 C45 family peptidase [Bacteroidota bacterium]
MPDKRKWKRRARRVFGVFILLLLAGIIYILVVSKTSPPEIADRSSLNWQRTENAPGFYSLKNSWFRKSQSGLYELYVEGKPYERGVVNGKLTKELLQKQEEYFNDQIEKMIPSKFYLHFLKYFVGWFNRDLAKYVIPEYKAEIYGVSASASDKYDYIGSNYQRILNYHAAHDIGHALQNLALVGCTSFGTWGGKSADSNMIIGRNFDFYVGEHFSENKIVAFENPSEGHKFMSVTWGGFIGVVSGMNDKGLTVTINAAKSSIPTGSATPVSLVAREILQYAENIPEAIAIAHKRKMFVSESFLVGSAEDGKAVIIEKTPDSMAVYDPNKNYIICANHFQSNGLEDLKSNQVQIRESASEYRYQRLQELLDSTKRNTVQRTVAILRDRDGMHNEDIGLGNEKAINQFIAHHSIVFEPKKRLVWVSTAPWQLGKYVCYDLNKVFSLAGLKTNKEISDSSLDVPADPFLQTKQYQDLLRFRKYKEAVVDGLMVDPDSLVASNPEFYQAYELAGNELFKRKEYRRAAVYYRQALTKVIATKGEENSIRNRIKKAEEETN